MNIIYVLCNACCPPFKQIISNLKISSDKYGEQLANKELGLMQFLFHGGVRYISIVIKDTFSIKVWRILLAYNDVDKTERLILSDADRSMFALWKNACM